MTRLETSIGSVQAGGRKYDVHFIIPQDAPIDHAMICFHGWVGNFQDQDGFGPGYLQPGLPENWLYVFPQDREGVWRGGSWWLGEGMSLVYDEVIGQLLDYVEKNCGIEPENIAFWGSSMGGFGALHHGLRRGIPYIMVNVPQTDLFDREYWEHAGRFLQAVFPGIEDPDRGRDIYPQADLKNLVSAEMTSLIDIETARFDITPQYYEHQVAAFADRLCKYGVNFRMAVNPIQRHGIMVTPCQAARRWQGWQGDHSGADRYDQSLFAEAAADRRSQIETADLFE